MPFKIKPLPQSSGLPLSLCGFLALLAFTLTTPAQGQLLPGDTTESIPAAVSSWPEDSLGRRTPRGVVKGFIQAVVNENYRTATQYLSLTPLLQDAPGGEVLAMAMQRLLDHGGNLYPYNFISREPAGKLDDGLAPNLERVGTATVRGETFDLLLEMTEEPNGAPVWKFSSQTVQRVPMVAEQEAVVPLVNKVTPAALEEKSWAACR